MLTRGIPLYMCTDMTVQNVRGHNDRRGTIEAQFNYASSGLQYHRRGDIWMGVIVRHAPSLFVPFLSLFPLSLFLDQSHSIPQLLHFSALMKLSEKFAVKKILQHCAQCWSQI